MHRNLWSGLRSFAAENCNIAITQNLNHSGTQQRLPTEWSPTGAVSRTYVVELVEGADADEEDDVHVVRLLGPEGALEVCHAI